MNRCDYRPYRISHFETERHIKENAQKGNADGEDCIGFDGFADRPADLCQPLFGEVFNCGDDGPGSLCRGDFYGWDGGESFTCQIQRAYFFTLKSNAFYAARILINLRYGADCGRSSFSGYGYRIIARIIGSSRVNGQLVNGCTRELGIQKSQSLPRLAWFCLKNQAVRLFLAQFRAVEMLYFSNFRNFSKGLIQFCRVNGVGEGCNEFLSTPEIDPQNGVLVLVDGKNSNAYNG